MPVIRVSNEAYQALLRLQAEDGNSMSIFMDRFVDRYHDLEAKELEAEALKKELKAKPREIIKEVPVEKKITLSKDALVRDLAQRIGYEVDDKAFLRHLYAALKFAGIEFID